MSYRVLEADLHHDRATVLDLWKQNLPGASPERYAWLYESGSATGWTVHSAEGDVVGAAGLMARWIKVFDEVLAAGQAIDLNVQENHRTIGPALGLQRALTGMVKQDRIDFLYSFPNPQSEPVQRRVGFQVLDHLGRWARPLRFGETLRSWVGHPLLQKMPSALVDPCLYLRSPETFYRRRADVRVHVTDHFDGRFDALWKTASPRFPVVGERTSAYLTWRFRQCPDACYRVLCLSNAEDELLAYLVYHRRGGMVHVGDFFFADIGHLEQLLGEFLRLMRSEKAEAIIAIYLGSSEVCRTLKRFGFWQRPCTWKTLLYVDRQPLGEQRDGMFDRENWHLTQADIDTDL